MSVETDPQWISHLREHRSIAKAERSGRLCLLHADVGPVGNWGIPTGEHGTERYANYAPLPWAICDNPDLVLVDGRFRVASALVALLRGGSKTKIAFHDFWERPHYHAILPFVDCEDSADTLAIFKKPSADRQAMTAQFAENSSNPA